MMRGVSTWAVAVRAPSAEQLAGGRRMAGDEPALGDIRGHELPARLRPQAPPLAALAGHPRRRRARRVAAARLPALNISVNTQLPDGEEDISRGTWAGTDRRSRC